MNLEILEKIARGQKISDECVETSANLLIVETLANDTTIIGALKILKKHRPEIAKKIARKILATETNE